MIVVTAPTGHIGSQVLRGLLDHGEIVRVVVRDPRRLPTEVRDRVEVVVGSHTERDVIDRALEGADALFWLLPPDPQADSPYDAYVTASIPAADAVIRHAVDRVVIISALGQGSQIYAGHVSASHVMEALFASTGAHVRVLAMPSFMDNLLRQVAGLRQGTLTGTLPSDRKMPLVATRDVAERAIGLLVDRSWQGLETLEVLGPENLSNQEIADVLSEVLGHRIEFVQGDREADVRLLVEWGFSPAMAESMMAMDRAGEAGINDLTVRSSENTSPTTLRQFAEDVLRSAVLNESHGR